MQFPAKGKIIEQSYKGKVSLLSASTLNAESKIAYHGGRYGWCRIPNIKWKGHANLCINEEGGSNFWIRIKICKNS